MTHLQMVLVVVAAFMFSCLCAIAAHWAPTSLYEKGPCSILELFFGMIGMIVMPLGMVIWAASIYCDPNNRERRDRR